MLEIVRYAVESKECEEAEERARKLEESQTLGVYNSDEELAQDVGCNAGEVSGYEDGFKDGARYGYNKAFIEADKNLKAIVTDFNKAKELIKRLYDIVCGKSGDNWELIEKAEQFLNSEVVQ